MLEDIAILTGGKADLRGSRHPARKRAASSDLGRAKKVKIDKDNTIIIEGAGKKDAIKARVAMIQRELEKSTSDYDKEKLSERIAKLSGGVAKINVGAATESEMKEKKMRVEDAMHATRAANQEGILPGGGVALLRASAGFKPTGPEHGRRGSATTSSSGPASRRSSRSSRTPARTATSWPTRFSRTTAATTATTPASTATATWSRKASSTRPRSCASALQNAASVATLLLTSDALVADLPKDEKKPAGGGGGYDDMY